MWVSWYKRPFPASILVVVAVLFALESLFARLRAQAVGGFRAKRVFANALFISPVLYKYARGGFVSDDLSGYPYIQQAVNPLEELGHYTVKSRLFTIPRAVYIEDDVAYTGYLSDVLFMPGERYLYAYDMKTSDLKTLELPGYGVRNIFSRVGDPYLYFIHWKYPTSGVYRVPKGDLEPDEVELIIDLTPYELTRTKRLPKELLKLYQLSDMYVDDEGRYLFLISEVYPAIGRYDLEEKRLVVLDLKEEGYCPLGSFFAFQYALDPDRKYMYLSSCNCYCGVFKVDMATLEVKGCYRTKKWQMC